MNTKRKNGEQTALPQKAVGEKVRPGSKVAIPSASDSTATLKTKPALDPQSPLPPLPLAATAPELLKAVHAPPAKRGKRTARETEAPPANEQKEKRKDKKQKLVRDSFTMPEDEYKVLGDLKRKLLTNGVEAKKSQLLRVAVAVLREMDIPSLQSKLAKLAPLKAGRPKVEK